MPWCIQREHCGPGLEREMDSMTSTIYSDLEIKLKILFLCKISPPL